MSRTPPEVPLDASQPNLPVRNLAQSSTRPRNWNAVLLRCCLVAAAAAVALNLSPFGVAGARAVLLGVVLAGGILLAEQRLRRASASAVLGGALGGLLGALAALLITVAMSHTAENPATRSFFVYACLLGFG